MKTSEEKKGTQNHLVKKAPDKSKEENEREKKGVFYNIIISVSGSVFPSVFCSVATDSEVENHFTSRSRTSFKNENTREGEE